VTQLLAQDVLALLRGERLLGLLADLLGDLEHLHTLHEKRKHLVEPRLDVDRLQHVLLFRRLRVEDAGDEVGQRGRRIQGLDRGRDLRRHVREELQGLARAAAQQADARLDVGRHHLGGADVLHPRDQERKSLKILDGAKPPHALRDDVVSAVGGGDVAQHLRRGPHRVQLVRPRLVDRRIGLQHDPEHALAAHRRLGGRDGRFPADGQRQHDPGEQHGLPDRQYDHGIRRERRMLLARPGGRLFFLLCHGVTPASSG
jgi:hypothetical protein